MTILVTGGAGYIGSQVVLELCGADEEVVVLDNLSTGFRWLLPDNIEFVEGDVGNRQLVSRVLETHEVDSIIHLAASIVVPESIEHPLAYYHNNVTNSHALLECAVSSGVKHFIFSSTAAVYGIPQRTPVSESDPAQPISPYGWSKLMTEIMLSDTYHADGLRYVALRYFNVAGADPQGRTGQASLEATHLIKVACLAALGLRDGVEIYGANYPTPDGTGVRDFIHVADLAKCHLAGLKHLRSGGPSLVLNCGYGHGYSVLEVIEAFRRIAPKHFQTSVVERRPGDAPILVADTTRIRKTLDWQPRYDDLDLIVSHALAWEQSLANRAVHVVRLGVAGIQAVSREIHRWPLVSICDLEVGAGRGKSPSAHLSLPREWQSIRSSARKRLRRAICRAKVPSTVLTLIPP